MLTLAEQSGYFSEKWRFPSISEKVKCILENRAIN
jgi:hypothetical protein